MKSRSGNPLIGLRASHDLVAEVHCVFNGSPQDKTRSLPDVNRILILTGNKFRAYGHTGTVLNQAKFEVYAPMGKCAFPGRNRFLLRSVGQFGRMLCGDGYSLSHITYMTVPISVSPDGAR